MKKVLFGKTEGSSEKKFRRKKMTKTELDELFTQLEKENPGKYEIRKGHNDDALELLNNNTRLVIVGTAIPPGLPFFYMGKASPLYGWIDEGAGTGGILSDLKKKGDMEGLKRELRKLGVAFLDIAERVCNLKGSGSDNDIQGYVVDSEKLARLRELADANPDMVIVPASNNAMFALWHETGLEKEVHSLFRPKPGEKWKDNWLAIIRQALKKWP